MINASYGIRWGIAGVMGALLALPAVAQSPGSPSVMDYPSIQAAIDQNPGRRVFVPAGEHVISAAIRLTKDGSGLWGPGRIIQANPDAEIIDIAGAADVQVRDLILTRATGHMETHRPGIRIDHGVDVTIENVRVLDNWGDAASILAGYCQRLRVRHCSIENYSRIAIDDRTPLETFGYAFNCINGTGIMARHSTSTLIENNRIIESRLAPTREIQKQYALGKFVKKNPVKGSRISDKVWQNEYTNAWHQGAAIQVTPGGSSDYIQLLGNYVENAAQGMDVHGDHVVMAYNIVNNAFIGMKAVHGSHNVIVVGNQFVKNDLWSIQLQPGSESHPALGTPGAKNPNPGNPEAPTWNVRDPWANIDGHSLVANNIVSDFGYGHAAWVWRSADEGVSACPIQFNAGPIPGQTPPETDVIISGNVVYDTGRDGVLVDGQPRVELPRYKYAVKVGTGEFAPRGLRFTDNLFHPGTDGVSNIPLTP